MLKKLAKTILRAVAPKRSAAIESARINRHGQRILEKHGIPEIAKFFTAKYGIQVQSGPFAGMNYLDSAIGSSFVPKLIGSYECELHEIIEKILQTRYDVVVDVGCAEGYYAVGLAMKLAEKPRVYAFDTDKAAQEMCRKLATQNGVQNQVVVSGYCDRKTLEATLQGHSLLVCDCEGYEFALLDPASVPSLASTDILVELHDTSEQAITPVIEQRFAASHHVRILQSILREPLDYPTLSFLSAEQQKNALSEFRHGTQNWAYMTPKKLL